MSLDKSLKAALPKGQAHSSHHLKSSWGDWGDSDSTRMREDIRFSLLCIEVL